MSSTQYVFVAPSTGIAVHVAVWPSISSVDAVGSPTATSASWRSRADRLVPKKSGVICTSLTREASMVSTHSPVDTVQVRVDEPSTR